MSGSAIYFVDTMDHTLSRPSSAEDEYLAFGMLLLKT